MWLSVIYTRIIGDRIDYVIWGKLQFIYSIPWTTRQDEQMLRMFDHDTFIFISYLIESFRRREPEKSV